MSLIVLSVIIVFTQSLFIVTLNEIDVVSAEQVAFSNDSAIKSIM